jgi:hypothetical protein
MLDGNVARIRLDIKREIRERNTVVAEVGPHSVPELDVRGACRTYQVLLLVPNKIRERPSILAYQSSKKILEVPSHHLHRNPVAHEVVNYEHHQSVPSFYIEQTAPHRRRFLGVIWPIAGLAVYLKDAACQRVRRHVAQVMFLGVYGRRGQYAHPIQSPRVPADKRIHTQAASSIAGRNLVVVIDDCTKGIVPVNQAVQCAGDLARFDVASYPKAKVNRIRAGSGTFRARLPP